MAEILVKTLTRHRDSADPYFMKDWTAGDVVAIRPDGHYTKNKYRGAKRMGIVLLVDGEIPQDYAGKARSLYGEDYEDGPNPLIARTQKIIDLEKLFDRQKLKDLFNHDLLVDPVRVNKSYLDLFVDRKERRQLISFDKSGSFDNETVDVGPNGHSDANDFFEFESNVAISTGPVIGLCDEAFQETASIVVDGTGANSSSNYLEFKTTGAARHAGIPNWSGYHRIVVNDAACMSLKDPYIRVTGLQLKRTYTGVQFNRAFNITMFSTAEMRIGYCIATAEGANYNFYAGGDADLTVKLFNCFSYDSGRSAFGGAAAAIIYAWNCTAAGSTNNYHGFQNVDECKNCVSFDNQGDDFNSCTTVDRCASDDGTGTNAQTLDSTNNYEDEFTDYPNDDVSLVSGSCCVGNGTDNPGSGLYSDDIIENARSSTWDIGAFEYVAAGGLSIPVAMHHYTKNIGQ